MEGKIGGKDYGHVSLASVRINIEGAILYTELDFRAEIHAGAGKGILMVQAFT